MLCVIGKLAGVVNYTVAIAYPYNGAITNTTEKVSSLKNRGEYFISAALAHLAHLMLVLPQSIVLS